jgi:hypothetical protein
MKIFYLDGAHVEIHEPIKVKIDTCPDGWRVTIHHRDGKLTTAAMSEPAARKFAEGLAS